MKKLYDSKIYQYDLNGKYIQCFNNVREASVKFSNYDSIIKCCNKKYKQAGGYIWRFNKEKIINISLNNNSEKIHKCKICNSIETIRSMSMHLRWFHNTKTPEYIKKYGEYRPAQTLQIEKKDKSGIYCKECKIKLNSNQHLMYHISKIHPNITKSEYIIKNMLDNISPLCKCGCGGLVNILENGKNCDLKKETYHRDYIKGHWDWEVFSGIGKQSKEEIELLKFIETIYNGEIICNSRNIIKKGEIDIFLPELNIGIEYNELFWHSEKNGKFRDYHINKLKKCNNNGIRLIQIFSDEWINKTEIVKSKLNSIINPNKQKPIYARKCIIKQINPTDKNIFLNKYHIQGEDRSTIKLGLFYEENLVGVMTFSHPRISLGGNNNQSNIYELSRYASSNYIVGGSLKLIKYFQKQYNPKYIYSYSDNRWTDPNNNIYLKSGFIKHSTSNPNYFYTKNFSNRIHRYNFNKYKLKDMGADITKTESQIMEEFGYTKIWDCGSTKYILY